MKLVVIYVLLLVATLLTGCGIQTGEQQLTSTNPGIDEAFKPYVSQYETAKGGKINPIISIHFGSMGDSKSAVGLCYSYRDGRRDIVVDQEYWNYASVQQRKNLVWHELGHCDLGRDHSSKVLPSYRPASLMYPYAFSVYDNEILYYFAELFSSSAASHEEADDVIYVD